jgi:hypothetical protein
MENAGNMGQLEANATYIYEKADGITYARKLGDPPDTRFEIGRDYDREQLRQDLMDAKMWGEIRRAAKSNPALQEALDRVIVIYELSRQDESIMHHPV